MYKNEKLRKIKERFIKMEEKEKKDKIKKNKEDRKVNIVMIVIFAMLVWAAFFLIGLGYFITKLIWFIMILWILWYLCIWDN